MMILKKCKIPWRQFVKRRRPFNLNKKQDSLRKQPIFCNATTGSPQNDVWGTRAEIPYPWRVTICRSGLLQPITSTAQIWVVTRHQCGISALLSYLSLAGKPVVVSRNVGCFLRQETWLSKWRYKIPGFLVQFNITGVVILKVILQQLILRGELKHHYIVDVFR